MQNGHFYKSAVVKNNVFLNKWNVEFDVMKSFATRLFTFHPNLRNASLSEKNIVATSTSWLTLDNFIQKVMPETFEIDGYYG